MSQPAVLPFDSEAGFRAALDAVIAAAEREIRVFEHDLARMRLEEKARVEAIEAFLARGPDQRLLIVLHDIDHVEHYCPRLLALRGRFMQRLEFRQTTVELRHLRDAHLLADGRHGAIRFHIGQARGKQVSDDPVEIAPRWRRFEDLWDLSVPCLPLTRLGL